MLCYLLEPNPYLDDCRQGIRWKEHQLMMTGMQDATRTGDALRKVKGEWQQPQGR